MAQNAPQSLALGRRALLDAKVDEAAKHFEKAVALDADNSVNHLWLGRAYARQAQNASLFKQAGLAKKTRTTWQRAVALDPDNLNAREALVEFYLVAPGIAGGSVSKAEAEAVEIAKRNGARGEIARGRIMEKQKRFDDAERLYRAAFDKETKSAAARLGSLYQSQKNWEKMFALFDGLLRSDPSQTWALYHIGKAGALSGQRLDRAEEALLAYLRTIPGEDDAQPAGAHWRLGQIYEKKSELARAKAAYQAALKANPRHKDSAEALKRIG